jgi:hypothetical protein
LADSLLDQAEIDAVFHGPGRRILLVRWESGSILEIVTCNGERGEERLILVITRCVMFPVRASAGKKAARFWPTQAF